MKLVEKRNTLKRRSRNTFQPELLEVENEISNLEAEENRKIVFKLFKQFSDHPENINIMKMWKVFKNIGLKYKSSVPTAKKDFKGNLVTDPKHIKMLLSKEYQQRLRERPVKPNLGDIEMRKKEIFKMQLKLAEEVVTTPWTMSALDEAIANLKNNKARDHAGYANEIFKAEVIGSDLKKSLLIMCNKIKEQKMIPKFMKYANITTVPKKGNLSNLENERGIFRVDVIRSILMRLVYNEKYPEVDRNMSDSQMGGRKGKGCRNNIFIINGIIHDVIKNAKKPILLQIYDYKQMFDSINLQQAISDIYEAGLKDENLSLIYEANNEIFMAVNTTNGLTDRQKIKNSVLQGDTWGSLLASVQVDSIAKECANAGYGYKYKDNLSIGILGLVDDTIGVTEAGHKAHEMNAFFNAKTAEKKLQFGVNKCKTMLVGKDTEDFQNHSLYVDSWKTDYIENRNTGDIELIESYAGKVEIGKVTEQKYLGFTISSTGNNMANISVIRNKSIGTIRQIFDKLKSLKLGKYYFEVGILFQKVMLRSSILYACEVYYNLKECEIRHLERIEETYMRKLVETTKGCPINQLYLELGQTPARFDIIKQRLFFLKYVLDEDQDSLTYKVLLLQVEKPARFDWVSTCKADLKKLNIEMNFEDIRKEPSKSFKQLVRKKCQKIAFEYLMSKRGTKGSEITYKEIQTSEYLMPNNELSIDEKRKIFAIRNKMLNIPSNFVTREKNESKCICNEQETMRHIYECDLLNEEKADVKFEHIYEENILKQKKILKRMEYNLAEKKRLVMENHVIPSGDPPFSVIMEDGNG